MKKGIFIFIAIMVAIIFSCGSSDKEAAPVTTDTEKEEPDSMIYGLACDGTNDSVVVLLLFSGEDPKTYNIESAKANGKVIGQMQIGDWIGVMVNPEDTTEATMVIDLDQLKGTWTYEVRPTWKDSTKMSRRALRNKMAEIPDSLREAYMVPREYGFTLKRSSVATPVGWVMRTNTLEDDSPVEYPAVPNYSGWKCRNGRLFLTITEGHALNDKDKAKLKTHKDTMDFVLMTSDSLVLRKTDGKTIRYHRRENASVANAKAQKAANKTSDATTKNVTENK